MPSLLSPFFFVLPLVLLVIFRILGEKNWLSLEPDENLIKQKLFWFNLSIPIYYFFYFGLFVWNGYQLEFSETAFEKFIEISLFPFGILSLTIPFTYITARIHATEQTARLIKLTDHKNKIEAFNNHRNDLFSYFNHLESIKYEKKLKGRFMIHPAIHMSYFKGRPEDGAPSPEIEKFKQTKALIEKIRYTLHKYLNITDQDTATNYYLYNVTPLIYKAAEELHLPEIHRELAGKSPGGWYTLRADGHTIVKNRYFKTVGNCLEHLIASYRYINEFFNNLCDFSRVPRAIIDERHIYLNKGYKYKHFKHDFLNKMSTLNYEEANKYIIDHLKARAN